MSEFPPLATGSLVNNRYVIDRILGQGGIGRTYRVSDQQKYGDFYTLKEFSPRLSGHKTTGVVKAKELFEREGRILNQLDHPQIPKFHGFFSEDDRLFFVQDYVQGQNYREILSDRGALPEPEVLKFMENILQVLNYIHRSNIIHRDIAPDNIMFNEVSGQPVLIDFGIGKKLAETLVDSQDSLQRSFVGKPGYSAPEQIYTGICSEASDLYALAITVIELLHGERPKDLLHWQKELKNPVSEPLASVLTKMLAHQASDRYPSARAVLTILQQPATTHTSQKTWEEPSTPGQGHGEVPRGTAQATTLSVLPASPSPASPSSTPSRSDSTIPWPIVIPLSLLIMGSGAFWVWQANTTSDQPTDPEIDSQASPMPSTPANPDLPDNPTPPSTPRPTPPSTPRPTPPPITPRNLE